MRHIEINLSETKGYEQHVIVELIRGKSKKLSGIPFPRDQADYKGITGVLVLHKTKNIGIESE